MSIFKYNKYVLVTGFLFVYNANRLLMINNVQL